MVLHEFDFLLKICQSILLAPIVGVLTWL